MDLVRRVRDEIVDTEVSVSATLRRAKILAAFLDNKEVRTWVDRELGGYPEGTELPSYRKLKSPALGDFTSRYIGSITGHQLPISLLPEPFKELTKALPIVNPVREIETFISTSKKDLRRTWPTEALFLLRKHTGINQEFDPVEFYQPITKAQLEGVLDAVRNHLLDFILSLQEVDPAVLHSEEALRKIPGETVSQIFNVTIHGDHNVLASGAGVTQKVNHTVFQHNKDDLLAYLSKLGLSTDELTKLNDAIDEDGIPTDKTLGSRVKEWIGEILAKAVDGTWKTAVTAAPDLLVKAISSYYGWDK